MVQFNGHVTAEREKLEGNLLGCREKNQENGDKGRQNIFSNLFASALKAYNFVTNTQGTRR